MITIRGVLKIILITMILWGVISPAKETVSAQALNRTKVTKEERRKWWLDARFGMMITWGAYSQTGGYWKGKYEAGYSEWLKFDRKIPNVEYDSLVRAFNPVDFNAAEWVKVIKNAGMKYIVIMAKHHDGFALYNSAVSSYDIIDMTKFGRDPLRELADACQKAGIKFGVYYSVDRDWHHPDAACDDKYKQCNYWDYPENKSGGINRWHDKYFPDYALKQVTELVTQYPVDIFWFDGIGIKTRAEVALLDSVIHAHRPYCLINSRISNFVGSTDGDYSSETDNGTPNGYKAGGWENPGTLGFSYAYSVHDTLMSPKQAIKNLIEIVSKGGNYLLNVGPDGKGVIIPEAVSILNEIGTWLSKYGTSIYGADGIPVIPPDSTLLTIKPHQLFIHVLNWNGQKVSIKGMDQIAGEKLYKVKKVYMLADSRKLPLDFKLADGTLTINLSSCPIPKGQINKYAEVIVVSDGI
jgi:alpha-L-fucosidase